MSTSQDRDPDLKVSLGRHNGFVIHNRFETASIAVDFAISVVFIAGSLLFLFSLTKVGTDFFLLGSLAMAARPAIRLRRRMYLQKIGADREDTDEEGSYDLALLTRGHSNDRHPKVANLREDLRWRGRGRDQLM